MTTHLNDTHLHEYVDGVLDEDQQQAAAHHLTACPSCRVRLEELQHLFHLLALVEDAPLTTDLSARVLARLPMPRRLPAWLRPVLILEAAVALALLIWFWPTLQSWLTLAGEAGQTNWAAFAESLTINWPVLSLTEELGLYLEQARQFQPDLLLPMSQLLAVLGLALVVWLFGNVVLLKQNTWQVQE